jgi:hypothetical protein
MNVERIKQQNAQENKRVGHEIVYLVYKFLTIEPTLTEVIYRKFVAERLASASSAEQKTKNGGQRFQHDRSMRNSCDTLVDIAGDRLCQQRIEKLVSR